MQTIIHTLAKIAALRSQAESYLISATHEIQKENPNLDRAYEMAEASSSSMEKLRTVQAELDRTVIALVGALYDATHEGRHQS